MSIVDVLSRAMFVFSPKITLINKNKITKTAQGGHTSTNKSLLEKVVILYYNKEDYV